jgi:tetratricopeptide (TPR) repeat protein
MPTAQELTNQGFDLFASGKNDEAIAILKQAIAQDPNYIEAHRNIAMAYGRKGMLEEAVAAARRVIEIDPGDHLGYVSLSMFLQRQGKIPEAEEAMARGMAAQQKTRPD